MNEKKTLQHPLRALEEKLGYRFEDLSKLGQACHRKQARAIAANRSFERLEFLGDRVLGLAMADLLFKEKMTVSEGVLAKHFSTLVSKECCARVALSLDLPAYIDKKSSPSSYENLLACSHSHAFSDSMEAILGAIYLDSDFETAKGIIARLWAPFLEGDIQPPKDQKTILQEYAQQRYQSMPEYTIIRREGPDHAPFFTIKVIVKNIGEGEGRGATKRQAEQEASNALLEKIPDLQKWQQKKGKQRSFNREKSPAFAISPDATLKRRSTTFHSSLKRTKE